MPIRKDLLPLYKTPEYKAARERIVERAGNCCEQCGKPNGAHVETLTALRGRMYWRGSGPWRDQDGKRVMIGSKRWWDDLAGRVLGVRLIRVVLTLAHLDHNPKHNTDGNLKLLCQFCHLNYDKLHHQETRSTRKDGGRPLLAV